MRSCVTYEKKSKIVLYRSSNKIGLNSHIFCNFTFYCCLIYINDVHVCINIYIYVYSLSMEKSFCSLTLQFIINVGEYIINKNHKTNSAPSPMPLLNPHPSKVILHAIYQYPEFIYWFTINIQILQCKWSCMVYLNERVSLLYYVLPDPINL